MQLLEAQALDGERGRTPAVRARARTRAGGAPTRAAQRAAPRAPPPAAAQPRAALATRRRRATGDRRRRRARVARPRAPAGRRGSRARRRAGRRRPDPAPRAGARLGAHAPAARAARRTASWTPSSRSPTPEYASFASVSSGLAASTWKRSCAACDRVLPERRLPCARLPLQQQRARPVVPAQELRQRGELVLPADDGGGHAPIVRFPARRAKRAGRGRGASPGRGSAIARPLRSCSCS